MKAGICSKGTSSSAKSLTGNEDTHKANQQPPPSNRRNPRPLACPPKPWRRRIPPYYNLCGGGYTGIHRRSQTAATSAPEWQNTQIPLNSNQIKPHQVRGDIHGGARLPASRPEFSERRVALGLPLATSKRLYAFPSSAPPSGTLRVLPRTL